MHNYYPLLLAKRGEIEALRFLRQDQKDLVSPIIELIDNEHFDLSNMAKELTTHWKFKGNQLLIDFTSMSDSSVDVDIPRFLSSVRRAGVDAIPVVRLQRSQNQKTALRKTIPGLVDKACFRLCYHRGESIEQLLNLIEDTPLSPENIILILDFGVVTPIDIPAHVKRIEKDLKVLSGYSWKDLVCLAGSFPKDLSDFNVKPEPQLIRRHEEILYDHIKAKKHPFHYGDYCIRHPYYEPSGDHQGSCSIKYSKGSEFVILRGQITQNHRLGHGQYIEHAKTLVASEYFCGSGFSWGDDEILEISKQESEDDGSTTGNAMTWGKIGVNHHIAMILALD